MSDQYGLPDVREKDLKKACEQALELQKKSTTVNGWYAYSHGDMRADGRKTVRGPFCRWFILEEGNDDDSEGKSQGCLAPPEDDINYASFALNNVASIAKGHLDFKAALDEASGPFDLDWLENFSGTHHTVRKEDFIKLLRLVKGSK